MGVTELACVVLSALPGALVLALAWRRGIFSVPQPRAPLPLLATIVAAVSMLVGGAAGLVAGAALIDPVPAAMLPPETQLYATESDALVARAGMGALVGTFIALPFASAIVWLVRSRDRSPRAAALFGLVVALAFGVGAASGHVLAPHVLARFTTPSVVGLAPAASVSLGDVAAMHTGLSFALGVAGASLATAAAAASRSFAALKATLALSAAIVPAFLLLTALATPPDLFSQLLLATVLVTAWLVGLGLGAAMLLARRRAVTST